jgi:WD40 repeat protein
VASEALLRPLPGHTSGVTALAVLPFGRLASGSVDKNIKLWYPVSGACSATLEGHSSSVWALVVFPDGRLASGADDGTIRLWDPARADPGSDQLIFVADATIRTLAWLPEASLLVAGDISGLQHWLQMTGP